MLKTAFKPSKLPTLAIPQAPNPVTQFLRRELARFGIYGGLALALGASAALPLIDSALDTVRREAAAEAYNDFNEGWKERLVDNQGLLRSTCHAWWFNLSVKDRRLK